MALAAAIADTIAVTVLPASGGLGDQMHELSSAAGTFLGGLAAVAAVIFAHRESRNWRNRIEYEGQRTAIVSSLVALHEFRTRLRSFIRGVEEDCPFRWIMFRDDDEGRQYKFKLWGRATEIEKIVHLLDRPMIEVAAATNRELLSQLPGALEGLVSDMRIILLEIGHRCSQSLSRRVPGNEDQWGSDADVDARRDDDRWFKEKLNEVNLCYIEMLRLVSSISAEITPLRVTLPQANGNEKPLFLRRIFRQ